MTTMLTLALVAAFWVFTQRRADLREAGIEARFPPEDAIISVNGRETHVIVRGTGPDLVLIHGAGGNAREFTFDLVPDLEDRFRVFIVDRPGLGWSERLTDQPESPRDQARHLADAVRQLGAEQPLVVGHSYGGAVAMAWALEANPSGLVILSGATMPWPGDVDLYYRVLGHPIGGAILAPLVSAYAGQDQVETTVEGVFTPDPVPQNYLAGAGVPLAVRIETLRRNAAQVATLKPHIASMSEEYGQIIVPVEILHGTADKTVYTEIHAEPLAERLPNARLTLLDGTGHMPHHVNRDAVIDAIDRAAQSAGLR